MVRNLLLFLLALSYAAQCQTMPARQWTRITDKTSSADEVSLVRAPDSVLHVAWPGKSGPGKMDMQYATIAPDGKVQPQPPIITDWSTL